MFPFGNGRLARLTHTLSLSYFHTKKETREEDDKLNQLAYIFLPFDYLNRTISTGPISTSPGSFKKKEKWLLQFVQFGSVLRPPFSLPLLCS